MKRLFILTTFLLGISPICLNAQELTLEECQQQAQAHYPLIKRYGLIEKTNTVLGTEQKYVCVSRPRRFGKSMAANMLAAYYDRDCDTKEFFDKLKISQSEEYLKHLNQYDVLKINMQDFLSGTHSMDEMLEQLQKQVMKDLKIRYPEYAKEDNLIFVMRNIFSNTHHPFIILIDEWDCLFREYQQDKDAQKKYLDFLRFWLKDKDYIALAYMTGILPIKKYGSHSALNMFMEYSMTDPGELAEFFGFTEEEVKGLCEEYAMNFEEVKAWYDGYDLISHSRFGDKRYSIYSPKSVVEAMLRHKFGTYWNRTETYEALKIYIQMNMDGLKDSVIQMLAGEGVRINTGTFSNDMTTFVTKDDVLTLLVHLGYLTYNSIDETVSIPNKEVSREYVNAISTMNWHGVADSVESSRKLLESLWAMDADAVADMDIQQDYDCIKLPHHGSKYSYVEGVYAHADYGLISCGYNNRYGHPHTEVLQGLAQEGTKVLRTDEMGAVVFRGR